MWTLPTPEVKPKSPALAGVFFFSFIFISWRLITLQFCSGFCHTMTWISHGLTCIPYPDPPSHLPQQVYSYPLCPPPGKPMYMLLGMGPTSFLSMWISNYTSTIHWKDCPFPYWMVLSSFDNHLTIYVRIYFLAFFLSVSLSLMPKILFWLCSFIVSFEAGSVNFPILFLLFKIIFGYLGLHINFRMDLSTFAKSRFWQGLY